MGRFSSRPVSGGISDSNIQRKGIFIKKLFFAVPVALVILALGAGHVMAAHKGGKMHRLVIQVSESDVKKMNIALNNAINVTKYYGVGNVEIEIVTYGPGLNMFMKGSKVAHRLKALYALGNIKFGVCGNTMRKRKLTKNDLLQDAFIQNSITTSGVVRLIELQEQGYSYIKL